MLTAYVTCSVGWLGARSLAVTSRREGASTAAQAAPQRTVIVPEIGTLRANPQPDASVRYPSGG
jgi:hypothetical protein